MDTTPPIAAHTPVPSLDSLELLLEPSNAHRLALLAGELNGHLHHIEKRLGIQIHSRGNVFVLHGAPEAISLAAKVLQQLYVATQPLGAITPGDVHLALQEQGAPAYTPQPEAADANQPIVIRTKKVHVKPRGRNQQGYVAAVRAHDINFGVGPAGTGKTYLAVACAVEALLQDQIERILLVRPAVEAGKNWGFYPAI